MIGAREAPARMGPLAAVALAGAAALTVRRPDAAATAVVLGIGALGLAVRVRGTRSARLPWVLVVLLGMAAVAAVRGIVPVVHIPATVGGLLASSAAAVAEEALFRRAAYSWLERWGVPAAILGTAAMFALVHVPAYGVAALPLNLCAGVLFGWQRWASGTWSAPAATHLAANLLAYS